MAALGDLPSLAAEISGDLTAAGIPHAISGAVAMAMHGFVRATVDLDLLVVAPKVRLPEVLDIVRRRGFAGEDAELLRSLATRYFAALHSGPATVDIFVPAFPFHGRLMDRVVTMDVDGTPVPVVSVEDLIILKTLWYRAKDVADVKSLLAAAAGRVDATYLRSTLEGLLPAGDGRARWVDGLLAGGGSSS